MSDQFPSDSIQSSLMEGLAYAALSPGLRSILVFDASYPVLNAAASALQQMLKFTLGNEIEQVYLGGLEMEDDLWGRVSIISNGEERLLRWGEGLLTPTANEPRIHLVVIPDLTRLGLAAVRACVTLVGTEVAHLERHGQRALWHPQLYWLAGCSRVEVGTLSPHLLDRFSLRLNGSSLSTVRVAKGASDARRILTAISSDELISSSLPRSLLEHLQIAAHHQPVMTEDAVRHVFNYTGQSEFQTLRREIALIRLAAAIAKFEYASKVTAVHVAHAANFIGLSSNSGISRDISPIQEKQIEVLTKDLQAPQVVNASSLPPEGSLPVIGSEQSLIEPNKTKALYGPDRFEDLVEIQLPEYPYPEDRAPIKREVASLQLPLKHHSESGVSRGVVIGVERTSELRDIAIVSTLLAAAPYQVIRRKLSKQRASGQSILLTQSDLHRYRRATAAESLLMLLLDYTSIAQCNWQAALLPHLRKAYVERASVYIIQVGVSTATSELRAELVSARSILVPKIGTALTAEQGKATPLAHGFDIALRTLRHMLQHGRSTVRRAHLIIISDGRGNIPLEASRNNYLPDTMLVNQQGIKDALKIAAQIRGLKGLETCLLFNPQSPYYSELPLTLARTLGATIVDLPQLHLGEV